VLAVCPVSRAREPAEFLGRPGPVACLAPLAPVELLEEPAGCPVSLVLLVALVASQERPEPVGSAEWLARAESRESRESQEWPGPVELVECPGPPDPVELVESRVSAE
jgi:hypothetical protein